MAEKRIERRIAAILAADVVGYSRLMGEDEESTHEALKAHRDVIDKLIEDRRGSVFGSAGDSIMAEFPSAVEAVRCATEIQLSIDRRNLGVPDSRRMLFRIGIHVGDIMVEGEDRMGDSVNIAARLEGLATPGGVCLSDNVVTHVRDRLGLQFEDLGQHRVKNIIHPVHVYRVPLPSEFQGVSPFRGLGVFDYEDARFFHGRTKAIMTAIERLRHQADQGTAFLLIYGMSGTGKSSLVRAGLLSALINDGVDDNASVSRYAVFRPSEGTSPSDAMLEALKQENALPELAALSIISTSREGRPEEIAKDLAALHVSICGDAAKLFLVVDQMEELFTSEPCDADDRAAFIALLAALARTGSIWIIGTLRTDFLHHCANVPGFHELKDGLGSYELLPPTGPEIAQIIRNPARTVGLRFEESVDEGRLEDVLQTAAVRDPASLPLLEFVLDALYELGKDRHELTFTDYHTLGGLEGAISRRAEEIVGSLPDEIHATIPSVLRSLVTVRLRDETVTAKSASLEEIATTPAHATLVDAFVAARLFVRDGEDDERTIIRIAHEALLSHWPRAQAIIKADREFLETRARVQADTNRWLAEQKSSDLLLPQGKRLAEAEELLARHGEDLDDPVISYIEQSIAARLSREEAEREQERQYLELETEAAREREASARRFARRTRAAAIAALALGSLAAIGAAAGFIGQKEASRQAERAEHSAAEARLAEKEAERQALKAEEVAARAQRAEAQAISQAERAEDEAERARWAEQEARVGDSLYRAVQARQMLGENQPITGMQLALAGLPRALEELDRPWVSETAGALVETLGAKKEKLVLQGHGGNVAALAIDGDRIISGSWDNSVRIWDAVTGHQLALLGGYEADVLATAISPDGRLIASAGRDNAIQIWDAENGDKITTLTGHGRDVLAIAFSPDSERIVSGSSDKTVKIWDPSTGREIRTLPGLDASVYAVAFAPDGREIISGSRDGVIRIWNARIGEQLDELTGHEDGVLSLVYSKDGTRIISGSGDQTVRIWDAASRQEMKILKGHSGEIYTVAIFADDRRIATGSRDGTIRIWDAESGDQLDVLKGHTEPIYAIATTDDGRRVVSGSKDRTIRIWDVDGTRHRRTLKEDDTIRTLAPFPNGDTRLVISAGDGDLRIWDSDRETARLELTGHVSQVLTAAVSPDGRVIASGSSDNTIRLWDAESGRHRKVIEGHSGDVTAVAFSPLGDRIVSGSGDNSVRIWDAETGRQVRLLKSRGGDAHAAGDVTAVVVSSDGRHIVSGSRDNTVRVWDMETGRQIQVLKGHRDDVSSVAVFPQSKRIASASADTTIRLWDGDSGQELRTFRGHEQNVNAIAVSHDGRRMVSASNDQTIRLWDTTTGEQVLVLRIHGANVLTVAWSADGAHIVSGGGDETVRMTWVGQSKQELLDTAYDLLPRELTDAEKRRFHLKIE